MYDAIVGLANSSLDAENAKKVFEALKRVEDVLSKQKYIVAGDRLTEADIRLFTTILRFDPVYFGHFKCNLLSVSDCPNVLRWLRMIANLPGVKETINMEHIKVKLLVHFLELSRNITTCPINRSIRPKSSPFLMVQNYLIKVKVISFADLKK